MVEHSGMIRNGIMYQLVDDELGNYLYDSKGMAK